MSWDIGEKIIVALVVACSAGYLVVRLYNLVHTGKCRGDRCTDCPTRSACHGQLENGRACNPAQGLEGRNVSSGGHG